MAGIQGFKTTISLGGTLVGDVETINGPDVKVDTVDVSSMDSPGQVIEKVAGWIDSGQIGFTINYQPGTKTNQKAVITAMNARTVGAWIITFPDNSQCSFSGFVNKFQPKAPLKGKLTADIGIEVTGVVTWPS